MSQSPQNSDDPRTTLDHIRTKMERVAAEFAEGKINRAQFNAIYGHHSEQRAIIEMLIKRDPNNEAWRRVAHPGRTSFLRNHFEAQPVFYVIFKHHVKKPLTSEGQHDNADTKHIVGTLKQLWQREKIPDNALARLKVEDGRWMILAVGKYAASVVIFSLQPSNAQARLVRDLHQDFEKANQLTLRRNLPAERMVFPHRSLLR